MKFDYFDVVQRSKKKYALIMEPVCRRWDLTKNELDVLLFLHNNPEFDRAADMVTHRGMTKSHVSLSVTNLESRGLLERREDPEDRRTVRLILKEEGRTIAAEGREYQARFFRQIFRGLTREELLLMQGMMERIYANIESMDE